MSSVQTIRNHKVIIENFSQKKSGDEKKSKEKKIEYKQKPK